MKFVLFMALLAIATQTLQTIQAIVYLEKQLWQIQLGIVLLTTRQLRYGKFSKLIQIPIHLQMERLLEKRVAQLQKVL